MDLGVRAVLLTLLKVWSTLYACGFRDIRVSGGVIWIGEEGSRYRQRL